MNYKEIKAVADKDSLTTRFDEDSGIVAMHFSINEISFNAQYGAECNGVYAFGLADDNQIEQVFKMLKGDKQ